MSISTYHPSIMLLLNWEISISSQPFNAVLITVFQSSSSHTPIFEPLCSWIIHFANMIVPSLVKMKLDSSAHRSCIKGSSGKGRVYGPVQGSSHDPLYPPPLCLQALQWTAQTRQAPTSKTTPSVWSRRRGRSRLWMRSSTVGSLRHSPCVLWQSTMQLLWSISPAKQLRLDKCSADCFLLNGTVSHHLRLFYLNWHKSVKVIQASWHPVFVWCYQF